MEITRIEECRTLAQNESERNWDFRDDRCLILFRIWLVREERFSFERVATEEKEILKNDKKFYSAMRLK